MDASRTSEWLKLGLGIFDNLDGFQADGRTIAQMSIRGLREGMPMESALVVNKAIRKAGKRDLEKFDLNYAEVLRAGELQPIGDALKPAEGIKAKCADESVISMFGDKFIETFQRIRRRLKNERWIEAQRALELEDDEMAVYASFLASVDTNEYGRKVFRPFISRTPAGFFKTRDFLVRLLSALRKLTALEEGVYDVRTMKGADYFSVGEAYVFPSFALGSKFKEAEEEEGGKDGEGKETTLRLSGRMDRGHALRYVEEFMGRSTESIPERVVFEPEVSFRVTRKEEGEGGWVVYCEFAEDGRPLVLGEAVEEFEEKPLKTKDKTSHPPLIPKEPRYADPFPPPLNDVLKIERGYKPVTLEEAIKKACFDGDDKFIKEAKKDKMKKLKRIAKDFDLTEEDVMAIFVYTLGNEKDKSRSLYKIVNSALSKRSRDDLLKIKDYVFYLLQGLRSLPRFKKQNVLYRGVKMPQSVAREIYREGRTLTWSAFSSTSTDEEKARYFAGKNGVIFEIHGKFRGYGIGTVSKYGLEEGNTKHSFYLTNFALLYPICFLYRDHS